MSIRMQFTPWPTMGYQMAIGKEVLPLPYLDIQGIKSNIAASEPTNPNTTWGMTWTNRNVLAEAQFADFELNPIHIPNQASASRFPRVVTVVVTAEITIRAAFSSPKAPVAPIANCDQTEAVT